jgi:hypothetical protein
MPCFTITTVTVDAGKMQLDLAEKALAAMGLSPRRAGLIIGHSSGQYDRETGKATWRGQDRTAELKRAYSFEVVKSQAVRFGWTLKADAKQPGKFELIRR